MVKSIILVGRVINIRKQNRKYDLDLFRVRVVFLSWGENISPLLLPPAKLNSLAARFLSFATLCFFSLANIIMKQRAKNILEF